MRPAHSGPLLLFAALALLWTFPLVLHLGSHVPGDPGDNYLILWNFWWMRHVLSSPGLAFFHSSYLFAPFGFDLVNHPHTALPGLIGATVFAPLPLIAALNAVVLLSVFANFVCAYFLAYDIVPHRRAAVLAGVIFGASPYVSAHLLGHFDLINAWVLPLFALCVRRALMTGAARWMIGAGVVLALAAYSAYYYVVYLGLLSAALVIGHLSLVHVVREARPQTRVTRTIRRTAVVLLLLDAALILWAVTAGGGALTIAGQTVSIRSIQNPLTLAWILFAAIALSVWRLPLRLRLPAGHETVLALRTLAWATLAFVICAAPLVYHAVVLAASGGYVTQTYVWRNAIPGIDLAALALGNSHHPLLRDAAVFDQPWFDHVEGVAWFGVVPLVLLVWPRRERSMPAADVRAWYAVLTIAFVWALGPRLHLAGFDLGLPLPEILAGFVPLVNNARVPGRTMALVYLALAVLAAARIPTLTGRWQRPAAQWALVAIVLLDFLPVPMPLTRLQHPAVYTTLARQTDGGAVCEVPFGFGDGMADTGSFARDNLYYATLHEHPVVGGYIGRKPPNTDAAYAESPVLTELLRFASPPKPEGTSERAEASSPFPPRQPAATLPCRYIVIDRTAASPESVDYLRQTLPLSLLHADGGRELYRVE